MTNTEGFKQEMAELISRLERAKQAELYGPTDEVGVAKHEFSQLLIKCKKLLEDAKSFNYKSTMQ